MATRPIFRICKHPPFYIEELTEFEYFSGFAEIQKQRSIRSLHEAYLKKHPQDKLLEISTKSSDALGVSLSAFSLHVIAPTGAECSLEALFQGSKVFEDGGPYTDLYQHPPWEAKKDPRLKGSGKIVAFRLGDIVFPTEPKTYFYDWIYANALNKNRKLVSEITDYSGFTDIEFNPKKSLNCQARSAAIFISLEHSGLLQQAISSPTQFLEIVYHMKDEKNTFNEGEQLSLFI